MKRVLFEYECKVRTCSAFFVKKMISFLFLFLCINLDKVVFTVWSDEESAEENLIPLSKTWFRFVPEVQIIFPSLSNQKKTIIQSQLYGNVTIHVFNITQIKNYSKPYDINEYVKFISYKYIYNLFPDKELYYFGDDRTFVFPRYLYDIAYPWNLNRPLIYSAIASIKMFDNPEELQKDFITNIDEIGVSISSAGQLLTKSLLHSIDQNFLECSENFTKPHDISLAICIDNKICSVNTAYVNIPGVINGSPPEENFISNPAYANFPIGLPRATYPAIDSLSRNRLLNSFLSQDSGYITEWSEYSLQHLVLPESDYEKNIQFAFGYAFYRDNLDSGACFAKSPIQVVKSEDNGNLTSYFQSYSCGYTMNYICDDTIDDVQLVQVNGKHYHLKLKCPIPIKESSSSSKEIIDVNLEQILST